MPALIDQATHDQIFEMRKNGLSYQKIADGLNLNKGQVARELKKPATPNGDAPAAGGMAGSARGIYDDPVLASAAARLEAKKLELQEKQLDRQLALLDTKSASGDAGMTMVLLDQMRRMQEDVDRKLSLQAAPAKPPEDPMTSMVRGMGMLAEIQQKAQLLAPPAPIPAATNAADVEFRLLMEKMKIETEATTRSAAMEAERNAFIFSTLKENAPLLIGGFQKWMENQSKRQQDPRLPRLQVLEGGQTEMVQPPPATELAMTCGACQSKFMVSPEPGEIPICTVCGGPLQPDTGPPPAPRPSWPDEATFG